MHDRLDPRWAALLREEQSRPDPEAEVQARVLARIRHAIRAVPADESAPRAPAPDERLLPPTLERSSSHSASRWLAMGALALLGAGATALAVHARHRDVTAPSASGTTPPLSSVSANARHAPLVPVAPVVPLASAAPAAPNAAAVAHGAPAAVAIDRAAGPGDLHAERELLDRARTSLLDSDPDDTLSLVNEHASRFPRGLLVEERDALRVEALAGLGRTREACAGAAAFRRAHPASLLGRAVDDACTRKP